MLQLSATSTSVILTVVGDLDLSERDQFPETSARVAGLRRGELILDLCGSTFIDSTGASFLIDLAEASERRGGRTILRGASERDLFVFDVCGALDLFQIDHSHECAPQSDGALVGPAYTRDGRAR